MKVILAPTVEKGRFAQQNGFGPADARIASPRSIRSFDGARVTELYVLHTALRTEAGGRALDVLRRNLAKTPGARNEVILL